MRVQSVSLQIPEARGGTYACIIMEPIECRWFIAIKNHVGRNPLFSLGRGPETRNLGGGRPTLTTDYIVYLHTLGSCHADISTDTSHAAPRPPDEETKSGRKEQEGKKNPKIRNGKSGAG